MIADEPAAAARSIPVQAVPSGNGSVLLVDDEELVRCSVAASLREIGFKVAEAASGLEALRRIEGGSIPDLSITDHMMPGLTGAALARRVRTLHPPPSVLLVTGYASLTDDESSGLEALAKPFRMADLAARIAQFTAPEC